MPTTATLERRKRTRSPRTSPALAAAALALTVGLVVAACSGSTSTPTPAPSPTAIATGEPTPDRAPTPAEEDERHADAVALAAAADAATLRAREIVAGAVLRQLGIDPGGQPLIFRFTDAAATQAVNITLPTRDAPIREWRVISGHLTPLLGHPGVGIDVRALRTGPAAVARAAVEHWSGCQVRSMTLVGDQQSLTWHVSCETPEGVVSGTVDGLTGEFSPSAAPPVRPPPTATPAASTPTSAPPTPAPTATSTPEPTPEPTPTPPGPRYLPVPVPPKGDPIEQALRLKLKGAGTIEPIAYRDTDHAVGRQEQFNVLDLDERRPFTVRATLRHVSPNAYFYVEDGVSIAAEDLERSARELEEHIIPEVRRLANPDWDPGAGIDSRMTILHARIPGVAGYFNQADLLPRAVYRFSQERPMIYVNVRILRPGTDRYFSVLAHELQHAAQAQADPVEQSWMQEGASEYVAQAAGYGESFSAAFLSRPDTQLTTWPDESSATLPHYGAAYLFYRYLSNRFGQDAVASLISSQEQGIRGVDEFLAGQGVDGGFDAAFVDWATEGYLHPRLNGPDSSAGDTPRRSLAATLDGPGELTGTVHQYAADYIKLAPEGASMRLTFQGPASSPLIPTEAPSGEFFWWSNRGDSIDTTLTRRFDLTGVSRATLSFSLWYDIEQDYDYAYVEASRDGGETWDVLPGEHTTDDDPVDQSFGPAYTGISGGGSEPVWVRETVDLTPYAGALVWIRFEYITDQAVDNDGLAIDDLAIPEIGYADDAESLGEWKASGFVRSNNLVAQRFAVRVLVPGDPAQVITVPLDSMNRGELILTLDTGGVLGAVLMVAALAQTTTAPVEYVVSLEPVADPSPQG